MEPAEEIRLKTKRVKINAGETLELYIRKDQRAIKCYSTISEGKLERDAVQKTVSIGLKASLIVVGPASISFVTSKKNVKESA